MPNYVEEAKILIKKGVSVVPLRTDGSKLPKIKWSTFIDRIMDGWEVEQYFRDCGGIACVTGRVSRLYNLDFDLKYQTKNQDFWAAFMDKVPKDLKKKMLINETKNKGKHIWLRTDYESKSSHLTTRASLIPELMEKYEHLMSQDLSPEKASEVLLKNPYEVVIESRSRGSYAVFLHPDYKRFYGTKFQEFSIEEVESLNEIAHSLDYCFIPKQTFNGDISEFKTIKDFNEKATPELTLSLLEGTGMFKYVSTSSTGNVLVLRQGSKAQYSGKIFRDTAVLHLFTHNTIFDTSYKTSFSPFEVFMVCKNLTQDEAIKELSKN